jgi:hypothetical protein
LQSQVNNIKTRSSYFKANPLVMQRKGNVELLMKAWKLPIKSEHPQVRFHIAKSRLRSKYLTLQKQLYKNSPQITALQEEIDRLKHSIQNEPLDEEI